MSTPWQLFSPHRARVTGLILESAPAHPGTLCLLGAGRCRDVDLGAAARRFAAIHLVDRSGEAIGMARARQRARLQRQLHLHGGLELGGAAPGFVSRLAPCDVVASTCLLSQLVFAARADERGAVVAAHLRALVALTVPGGVALLVNDVATAARGLLESRVLAVGPAAALAEAEAGGIRYPDAAPSAIAAVLARDPALARDVGRIEPAEPWVWTRVSEQSYLVHALRIWRAARPRR